MRALLVAAFPSALIAGRADAWHPARSWLRMWRHMWRGPSLDVGLLVWGGDRLYRTGRVGGPSARDAAAIRNAVRGHGHDLGRRTPRRRVDAPQADAIGARPGSRHWRRRRRDE